MIILSTLLWRSERKKRIWKKKAENTRDSRFAKAELDAIQSQRPDNRARELPGDMAHELTEHGDGNEILELPGDTAHELGGENNEHRRSQKGVRFSKLRVWRNSF